MNGDLHNALVKGGVSRENILWLGFDDERLKSMASEELDEVITSYMEMVIADIVPFYPTKKKKYFFPSRNFIFFPLAFILS